LKGFKSPLIPLFQRGNAGIFFQGFLAIFLIAFMLISAPSPLFGSTKVKSEKSITGEELKKLIGDSQQLAGLTELSMKTYETASEMDDSAMESFVTGYRERLMDDGWQMMLQGMNKGRFIMIYTQGKGKIQDKLMIVVVGSKEVSEVTLSGKINVSDLEDLRDALLKSLPKYSELKPLEELLKPDTSPSQSEMEVNVIDWIKQVIAEEGDKASPSMFLELADHYKDQGDYDNALKNYVTITNASDVPGSILIQALFNAGWINERNLNIDGAKKYYDMLVEKFGNADIHEEDYVTAAELALRRLDKVKDEPRSVMGVMETADNIFLRMKDYASAIDNYESLVKNMPDSVYVESAMIMIGISYGRLAQTDPSFQTKQIGTFKSVVEKFPSSISHLYLGMAYKWYPAAIIQYRIVINDYPKASTWQMVKALYNAGEVAKNLGWEDDSKAYFKQLVERYSNLNSPMICDVEVELIKEERGGKLPFLGLGFRYTSAVKGAFIVTVFKNGPSKGAGVQQGDIIRSIDAVEITNLDAVIRFVAKKNVGDQVILHVKRGEDMLDIPVTLIETPDKLER
jgi:tetratricopeptide (TPR) repeat protein